MALVDAIFRDRFVLEKFNLSLLIFLLIIVHPLKRSTNDCSELTEHVRWANQQCNASLC